MPAVVMSVLTFTRTVSTNQGDSERRKAKPLVIHKWFANELPESLGFTVKSTPCKPRLVSKS